MKGEQHIARAKECIARGEGSYMEAVEAIQAARESGWSWPAINRELGRGEKYAERLVAWANNPGGGLPFSRSEGESERKDNEAARRAARERPSVVADAIKQAPREQRKQLIESLMQEPEIRVQASAAASMARDEQTAQMREKARAQDQGQRDRLAWVNIETEFDKVHRALTNALLLARECNLDDEARELLTERAHELRSALDVVTMALSGAATVDWDAELAKLDAKGGK